MIVSYFVVRIVSLQVSQTASFSPSLTKYLHARCLEDWPTAGLLLGFSATLLCGHF